MGNDAPEVMVGLTRADAERLLKNYHDTFPMALDILMSRKDEKSVDQVEYMKRVMEAIKTGLKD